LWLAISLFIKRIVGGFVESGLALNNLYGEIYRGLHERKLMRINAKREDLRLTAEQLRFIRQATVDLAHLMHFEQLPELRSVVPNELALLKMLLSVYRRARKLAQYVRKRMIKL
jgi:hypothetical protein